MEIIDYLLSGKATEKYVILLLLLIVFILGILLIVSGIKIKKRSKLTGIVSILLGSLLIPATLYFAFWTIFFGYNS